MLLLPRETPIYIVSKGRHDSRLTSKALELMGVPYFIVVEEQEHDLYAAVIDPAKILVLDKRYQRDYDCFDQLGDTKTKGAGPARNFAWDHALSLGAKWHWCMDDNIRSWLRFNRNRQHPFGAGSGDAPFRAMEQFCWRYKNVPFAAPQYMMFVPRKLEVPPYTVNSHIYSCSLIRNDLPFRWRGRYNEDTDMTLRVLKAGWCTIVFNAFLQMKAQTQTVKGGLTDGVYKVEGTLPKSRMLVAMHPDVTRLVRRFGRWHHHVDYSRFKKTQRLLRRDDLEAPSGVDEFGMKLVTVPGAGRGA